MKFSHQLSFQSHYVIFALLKSFMDEQRINIIDFLHEQVHHEIVQTYLLCVYLRQISYKILRKLVLLIEDISYYIKQLLVQS